VDSAKHNYYKKLMELYEKGKVPTNSLAEVDIFHDNWCGIHNGDYCNCDPDIKLGIQRDETVVATAKSKVSLDQNLSEDTRPLEQPTKPCPHCGCKEFIIWQGAKNPSQQAISCNGCGAVLSSTHPLDPDDRPMHRPLP